MNERQPRTSVASPATTDKVVNAFSVDVEDYFQVAAFDEVISRDEWDRFEPRVEQNSHWLLQLLAEHDVKATFFVLGWIAERWPALIRKIHEEGHELASHGYDHQQITTQTPAQFRADIAKAKRILEDIAGVEVIGYRAPTYSIVHDTLWALDVIMEEGFRYDSSIFPIRHDRYGIPNAHRFPWRVKTTDDAVLWEFPIATTRLAGVNLPFVGGGYTRQLPWWFLRWGMRRLNFRDHQPAMVYIHPWEVDPEQPRQNVPLLNRIRHYRNLGGTRKRLIDLLGEFRFTTARGVLGL